MRLLRFPAAEDGGRAIGCKHVSSGAVRHAIIDADIKRERAKYKNSYSEWQRREKEAQERRKKYKQQ